MKFLDETVKDVNNSPSQGFWLQTSKLLGSDWNLFFPIHNFRELCGMVLKTDTDWKPILERVSVKKSMSDHI